MVPMKTPGPDGIHAVFLWKTVAPTLVNLVQSAFTTGTFPETLNATHISLVPKVSQPEVVGHLQPISLSNVAYKLITKCLVNRFRPFMKKLIG